MKPIPWIRVILSGILTGLVWTLLSAAVVTFFASDLYAAAPRLTNPGPWLMLFSLSINLVMGVWAMWLFAMVRRWYSSWASSVFTTAIGWWVIYSLSKANWGPYGMVSTASLAAILVLALPALIISVAAGARFQE